MEPLMLTSDNPFDCLQQISFEPGGLWTVGTIWLGPRDFENIAQDPCLPLNSCRTCSFMCVSVCKESAQVFQGKGPSRVPPCLFSALESPSISLSLVHIAGSLYSAYWVFGTLPWGQWWATGDRAFVELNLKQKHSFILQHWVKRRRTRLNSPRNHFEDRASEERRQANPQLIKLAVEIWNRDVHLS